MNLRAIVKSEEKCGMFTVKTSNNGRFFIPDFNFRDTTKVTFSAYDRKNRQLNLNVVLDPNIIRHPIPQFKNPSPNNKEIEAYSTYYSVHQEMSSIYESEKTTKLEEVVVTKKKVEKIATSAPSTFGQTPDATLYTKDTRETSLSLVDLIRRFAGVTVTGSVPNFVVKVRRGGTPLWVLNGVPLSKGGAQGTGLENSLVSAPVPFLIATMDISNVERIELLKGPASAIWGMRGANGVFLVYTKRGGGSELTLSPEFDIIGHATEREFYSPNYSVKLDRHSLPDYRATLYWNPSFTTDRNGNASLHFYNSVNAKQLQVAIEGLSEYGTPGAYLATFKPKD